MNNPNSIETWLKTIDDVKEDIKALPVCEHCNTVLDTNAKNLAGMLFCEDCNVLLTKAVIAENKEALRKHFGGKGILDRLFGVKDKSETGFKVLANNKWVAWYTNSRKDLEGENFSYDGLVRDVNRQNESGDYPELWFYHIAGTKHGQATQSFVKGDMVVAVGTFDDTPLADSFKKYYEKSVDVALSHGFVYDSNKFNGTTYTDFKTFEISTLPRGKEANPFTKFGLMEIKDMETKANEDQKQSLVGAVGEDEAGKILALSPDAFQKATKGLEGVINYKAPMTNDEDEEMEEDEKPKKSNDSNVEAIVKALEPTIDSLTTAIKGLHERIASLEQAPKQTQKHHNPDITALLHDQKSGDEGDVQYVNPTHSVVGKMFGNGKQ